MLCLVRLQAPALWEATLTQETGAITRFRGKYSFLSNFYPAPVRFEGAEYPSVEHAYQAAKTTDFERRRPFQVRPGVAAWTASRAKTEGRRLELRPDWEWVKLDVMRPCLLSKFQPLSLKQKLLATGARQLIEENSHGDRFWGVYRGEGANWLGKLLMETRETVRFFRVEIPDRGFLAGGTPEEEAKRLVAWLAYDPRTDWSRLHITLPARLQGAKSPFLRAFFLAVATELPTRIPLLRKACWAFAGTGEDVSAAQETNGYVDAYFHEQPLLPGY